MKKLIYILFFVCSIQSITSQTVVPGDSLVYGPMFSPVYQNKVRVWLLTKSGTKSDNTLSLSMTGRLNPNLELKGTIYNSDDKHLVYKGFETGDLDSEAITRIADYKLRSYEFNIEEGETYTAKLLENGIETNRVASIKSEQNIVDDFTFLSGGCGRIFDLDRCIDQYESKIITNGDPAMYNNLMAAQDSDLMIWLGDAVYLLGEEHAHGGCPESFMSDWDNEEQAFKRYFWYRKYYDKLLQSMPQLAITDNHDTGCNEFNKTLPGLPATRKIFKEWWPNPEYLSTEEGEGLFSSYRYKDVEFFLTDNRSYRNNIKDQFGDEQLKWLEEGLLKSTAKFKIIINATLTFRELGGRTWSSGKRAPHLRNFIKENNIDGVLSYSADYHEQRFMLKEKDANYPLIDIVSGNLNSGTPETDEKYANYKIDFKGEMDILTGALHAFVRTRVYGSEGDRRLKIEYVNGRDQVFFSEIIHENTLTSSNESALDLAVNFNNNLKDYSTYNHSITASNISYTKDAQGKEKQAVVFSKKSKMNFKANNALNFYDKSYTLSFKVKPSRYDEAVSILSNSIENTGVSYGISENGKLTYVDKNSEIIYKSDLSVPRNEWSSITWKYNNLRNQLQLYYNGVLAQTWLGVKSSIASNANVTIGENFRGALDKLYFYTRLINNDDIKENLIIKK